MIHVNTDLFGKLKDGIRIGIGLVSDQLGYMQTVQANLGLASTILRNDGVRWSVGANGSFMNFGYVHPNFRARNPFDPRVPMSSMSDADLSLSAGTMIELRRIGAFKNFAAGASIRHINEPEFLVNGSYRADRHAFGFVTTEKQVRSLSVVLIPSFDWRFNELFQFEASVMARTYRSIRFGLGYRQWSTLDAVLLQQ